MKIQRYNCVLTDKSKNVTTQAAKVTVMAVTREFVDSMADEIIAKNISSGD